MKRLVLVLVGTILLTGCAGGAKEDVTCKIGGKGKGNGRGLAIIIVLTKDIFLFGFWFGMFVLLLLFISLLLLLLLLLFSSMRTKRWITSPFSILLSINVFESSKTWPLNINRCFSMGIWYF